MDAGKGDKPRPTDRNKFGQGWDRIFNKNKNKEEEKERKDNGEHSS